VAVVARLVHACSHRTRRRWLVDEAVVAVVAAAVAVVAAPAR
jgi:hypothetical protein